MKRSARRLAPKSEKRRLYDAELTEITPSVFERDNHTCVVRVPGCWGQPERTPHHRKRRSQRGPNTLANLLTVCTPCHRYVHANPAWSFDHGFLLHADDEITPLEVAR